MKSSTIQNENPTIPIQYRKCGLIRILGVAIMLLMLVNWGCMGKSDEEDHTRHAESLPHPKGWVSEGLHADTYLTQTLSCDTSCHGKDYQGGFTGIACSDCHDYMPHSDTWGQAAIHGKASRISGARVACAECHGEDYSGGKRAEGCLSCHPLYPHQKGWVSPDLHGQTVVEQQTSAVCATECHGTDFKGGLSHVSCYYCHQAYPHAENWKQANIHGDAVRVLGSYDECRTCHGADLLGGESKVSCLTCHPHFPHPDSWEDPALHAESILESHSSKGCATLCHGTDFKGGLSQTSCFVCHADYPHPDLWASYTLHGAKVKENGSDACATRCHGQDLLGGDTHISCYQCHAAYPHDWGYVLEHQDVVNTVGDVNCKTARGCHFSNRGDSIAGLNCSYYCHR